VKLILRRLAKQPDPRCTLGTLFVSTELTFCTLERPWLPSEICRGGADRISCVPPALYRLEKHDSEKHPQTWALVNSAFDVVHFDPKESPQLRSEILIHVANYPRELAGCIAVGTHAGPAASSGYQVFESRVAMKLLQLRVPWTNEHTIEIQQEPA
jgi:hypothetical protein